MPFLSVLFIRTAFIYLLLGFSIGALLLINKAFIIDPRIWNLLPAHFHILFLGWILQMVFGVAFWILPKFGSSHGNVKPVWLSYFFLNSGLILVSVLHTSMIFSVNLKQLFIPAAILIICGIMCFVFYAWTRVKPGMAVKL